MNPFSAVFLTLILGASASYPEPDRDVYTAQDAVSGAQFRSEASGAIWILFHPCPKSDLYAPVMARYDRIKGMLSEARSIDLAIAHADYDYQMSLVDIACPEVGEAGERQTDSFQAALAHEYLDRMEDVLIKASGDTE